MIGACGFVYKKRKPLPVPIRGSLLKRFKLYVEGALRLLLSLRNVSVIAATGLSLDLIVQLGTI